MTDAQPVNILRGNPADHGLSDFCPLCQLCIEDAYERMTDGGCVVSTLHMHTSLDRFLPGIEVYDPELFGVYPYATNRQARWL